jgi:hypothetical protein
VKTPIAATKVDIPEQVVVRRWGWPLEAETVGRTLEDSNLAQRMDFFQARITLPEGFTTVTPHPPLEVTTLTLNAGGLGLRAQIRCRDRSACGSFLAEITSSNPASGDTVSSVLLAGAMLPRRPKLLSDLGPVLVQPGRLALLVIDGNGFRISQPVMPLKRARAGELVRVTDPRTHRSWLAQVSGNGMLRHSQATRKKEVR